jgi:predicted glycosyl hydrolase (DUF1957 family)
VRSISFAAGIFCCRCASQVRKCKRESLRNARPRPQHPVPVAAANYSRATASFRRFSPSVSIGSSQTLNDRKDEEMKVLFRTAVVAAACPLLTSGSQVQAQRRGKTQRPRQPSGPCGPGCATPQSSPWVAADCFNPISSI